MPRMSNNSPFGDVMSMGGGVKPPKARVGAGGDVGAGGAPAAMSTTPTPGPADVGKPQMPNQMAPVPSLTQRRANAQNLYGPGGSGWQAFGVGGGGGQAGLQAMGPKPPAPERPRPPQGDPMQMGPPQPMRPPVGAGAGPAPAPTFDMQALLQNPEFMRMLMQYAQRGFGGGAGPGRMPGGSGPFNPNGGPQGGGLF